MSFNSQKIDNHNVIFNKLISTYCLSSHLIQKNETLLGDAFYELITNFQLFHWICDEKS